MTEPARHISIPNCDALTDLASDYVKRSDKLQRAAKGFRTTSNIILGNSNTALQLKRLAIRLNNSAAEYLETAMSLNALAGKCATSMVSQRKMQQ